jgi:peptidoglycan/xylan/chitin deacetylase (PgdA/CDA1 family)
MLLRMQVSGWRESNGLWFSGLSIANSDGQGLPASMMAGRIDGANMMSNATSLIRAVKSGLFAGAAQTGIGQIFQSKFGGLGSIFVLHRVVEDDFPIIQRSLVITVRFLDALISYVRGAGYDIVTLDEAWRRITVGRAAQRFVCFTFDDGYADVYLKALPVFQHHQAPMTVYVTSGMIKRAADYWWGALERIIRTNESIVVANERGGQVYATRTLAEKVSVYDMVCCKYHSDMRRFRPMLDELLQRYQSDPTEALDEDMLSEGQLRALAADSLVEIGAHGVTHRPLSHLCLSEARREFLESRSTLQRLLGDQIRHFAYPFGRPAECGDREFALAGQCGFATATTTQNGNLFETHRDSPHALPRLPIGGNTATVPAVRLQLSGLPSLVARQLRILSRPCGDEAI